MPDDYEIRWQPHPGPQQNFCSRFEFEVLYGGAAGGGKGLALDTPLPTPSGWITLGEVQQGTVLYDENGFPCRVIAIMPVQYRACFRVTFDDGSFLIADDIHRWSVLDGKALVAQTRKQEEWRKARRSKRIRRGSGKKPWLAKLNEQRAGTGQSVGPWYGAIVMETARLAEGKRRYAIPTALPLQVESKPLPLSPYVLGAWIGDGTSASSGITCDERYPFVIEQIKKEGYTVTKWGQQNAYGIDKIAGHLTALGIKRNKHIPPLYLRSSVQQRRDLLAGLMDTDGTIDKDGGCELTTTSVRLAKDYLECILSLGYKATLKQKRTRCQNGVEGSAYRIKWSGNDTPVRDPRKASRLCPRNRPVVRRRYINSIISVPSVATLCIAVDSPSNLYLAGRSMIPTHNTDCIVAEALRDVGNEEYRGILLRRTFPESEEIMDRCEKLYPLLDGEYVNKFWHFPSGAKIKVGSMQREKDKYAYRGKTYHYIGFDETSMFSPTQYLYLFSRCRSTNPNLKPRIRGGTNPGGEGHQFLKDRFQIGIIPPGQTIFDARTGLSRVFIPAKLKDNPTLALNDPDYVKRLMALPELERMRLMEGLWDAFEGQAIPELNIDVHAMERHGMKPIDIPKEWPRYRSFDWGYATPFSVGWWAADMDGRLYRYREWYGGKEGEEKNVGLRMNATEVAREIRRIEHDAGEKVLPGPADPDIWNPRWQGFSGKKFGVVGGSVAEDMSGEGVHFLQADNDRILGRQQVHKRLELDEKGDPQIMVSVECKDFWRTMPLLREYPKNPEDIESKHVEDHIYSEVRYMCMFKPAKPKSQEPSTFNTFQHERRKLIKARQVAARRGISLADAYGRIRG